MSFLDNLENNLKSLEAREDGKEQTGRDRTRRDADRASAVASAEHAERLRKGPYTAELLKQITRLGFAARTKVSMTWIGTTLRLEARGRRLELRPTPSGIVAVFIEDRAESRKEPVDLAGPPETLAQAFMNWLPPREEPPAELPEEFE
jgi:hypothetical protein